jgi:hypothetical protein
MPYRAEVEEIREMEWRIEPFILPLMVATLLLIAAMQPHS